MSRHTFNPKQLLIDRIAERGGWVNAHAHIDRAYVLDEENFSLVNKPLMEKWHLPDEFKKNASVEDIYQNMVRVVDMQIAQGVQALASFIDSDPVVEDKAIKAAKLLKQSHGDKITLRFINQVVKGVLDPEARKWFEIGAEFVDFIGGLPEKDAGHEAEHLDVLFEVGKKNGGKPLHVHVDQLNMPDQRDTELLVKKTIEHSYQGRVVAIHCISIGSQPRNYRMRLYEQMKQAEIIVIACPCAWIDNSWVAGKPDDIIGPIHNAVTPVKEMIQAGLIVALGTDGIQDLYKPFTDGDMWTELRFLLEAQHFYDLDALVDIASTNGRRAMFID